VRIYECIVMWSVTPCSLVGNCQLCRGNVFLNRKSTRYGSTSPKTVIFIETLCGNECASFYVRNVLSGFYVLIHSSFL